MKSICVVGEKVCLTFISHMEFFSHLAMLSIAYKGMYLESVNIFVLQKKNLHHYC